MRRGRVKVLSPEYHPSLGLGIHINRNKIELSLRVALIRALNHVGAQMNNTAITLTMSHFQWKQSHASASSRVLNVLNSARSKPLMCGTMAAQLS